MLFNRVSYTEITNYIKKNALNPVKIISISKNQSKLAIEEAIKSGIKVFGENRIQETIEKFTNLRETYTDLELHLTGSLQTNKVKQALSIFDVIQTLDREKLAKELAKYPDIIKKKLFFIQVNTGKEEQKSGIHPEEVDKFIKYCKFDLHIPVIGLMCIPPHQVDSNYHFDLLNKIAKKNNLKNLSMGMSNDFKFGILNGATHIRIGTKLFGLRK